MLRSHASVSTVWSRHESSRPTPSHPRARRDVVSRRGAALSARVVARAVAVHRARPRARDVHDRAERRRARRRGSSGRRERGGSVVALGLQRHRTCERRRRARETRRVAAGDDDRADATTAADGPARALQRGDRRSHRGRRVAAALVLSEDDGERREATRRPTRAGRAARAGARGVGGSARTPIARGVGVAATAAPGRAADAWTGNRRRRRGETTRARLS